MRILIPLIFAFSLSPSALTLATKSSTDLAKRFLASVQTIAGLNLEKSVSHLGKRFLRKKHQIRQNQEQEIACQKVIYDNWLATKLGLGRLVTVTPKRLELTQVKPSDVVLSAEAGCKEIKKMRGGSLGKNQNSPLVVFKEITYRISLLRREYKGEIFEWPIRTSTRGYSLFETGPSPFRVIIKSNGEKCDIIDAVSEMTNNRYFACQITTPPESKNIFLHNLPRRCRTKLDPPRTDPPCHANGK